MCDVKCNVVQRKWNKSSLNVRTQTQTESQRETHTDTNTYYESHRSHIHIQLNSWRRKSEEEGRQVAVGFGNLLHAAGDISWKERQCAFGGNYVRIILWQQRGSSFPQKRNVHGELIIIIFNNFRTIFNTFHWWKLIRIINESAWIQNDKLCTNISQLATISQLCSCSILKKLISELAMLQFLAALCWPRNHLSALPSWACWIFQLCLHFQFGSLHILGLHLDLAGLQGMRMGAAFFACLVIAGSCCQLAAVQLPHTVNNNNNNKNDNCNCN